MATLNPTIKEELAAIAGIFAPVPDSGKIITRERWIQGKEGYADLFTSLESNGKAHGILIQWIGYRNAKYGFCLVRRTDIFSIEVLYPYQDKIVLAGPPEVETTSHELFAALLQNLDLALNVVQANAPAWDLGLSATYPAANVEHGLLQATQIPFLVDKWGEGSDAIKAHYGHHTLEVAATRSVHPSS